MTSTVLARRDDALTPQEQAALLRDRVGDGVRDTTEAFGTFTLHVAPEAWFAVIEHCRDEPLLAYDYFDSLFGIDAREEGFDVVCVLYATSTGTRIAVRTRCPGERDAPTLASVTSLYRGADWHERETWDMFGIEFTDHQPGLAPRLLTAENFEGWPLRKDFYLTSRVAKPWPGVKEPAELDEEGNVIAREPKLGDAPGPYELDKAMAEQAKRANPMKLPEAEVAEDQASEVVADVAGQETEDVAEQAKTKAEQRRRKQAEQRARKAAERAAAAEGDGGDAGDEGAS